MHWLPILWSFALQLSLYSIAFGYQIDQSCVKEGIADAVHEAMESAIGMADAAYDRLTAEPRHATTLDLVAKLFARPGQNPVDAITDKTVDVLYAIRQNYRNEVPRGTPVGLDDILCPWFVDWIAKRKFKTQHAVVGNIGKFLTRFSGRSRFSFAQIDSFNLLDKVLLHEMTHGRAAYSKFDTEDDPVEGLKDVLLPGGYTGMNIINAPAFGWAMARKLAEKGGPLRKATGADNNADTLALFGSSTYSPLQELGGSN
ncbi:hypothetical protein CC86DRAFT_381954 [Ophiobolus disseminans]|uniref:Lysine-specific metallo-endopeptidase domain-containing protein n=1 Tax=Ophiobolus disseminans TaxID=1469910 RepID=A0A6A7A1A3_9PLEO|nr:hypothetical protein CC86DRAFT_381954 [Ophiobolus disseminans]